MYCYQCGQLLAEDEVVCSNCGAEQGINKKKSLYDYMDVKVDEYNKQMTIDTYDYFGYTPYAKTLGAIRFRRSRDIKNKLELNKLKHEADKIIQRIAKLERSKTSRGLTVGLIIGITGLLTFGTGLSLALTEMNFVLGIIVAVIGVIIAIPSFPVLKLINDKRSYIVSTEIDENMDYLSSLCESALVLQK